jgi:hypothetical protein
LRLAGWALCVVATACASTPAPLGPSVELGWNGQAAQLRIANPHAHRLEIVDPVIGDRALAADWSFVRVADQTDQIVRDQGRFDPDGWWTSLVVWSSLSEPRTRSLAPGEVIEFRIDPRVLIHGMRPERRPETPACRVQMRATVYSSRREAAVTQTTDWLEIPCAELEAYWPE